MAKDIDSEANKSEGTAGKLTLPSLKKKRKLGKIYDYLLPQ
jgi:hypothetical protein